MSKDGFNSPFGKLASLKAAKASQKPDAKLSNTKTAAEAKAVLAARDKHKSAPAPQKRSSVGETVIKPLVRKEAAELTSSEADEFLRAVSGVAPLGRRALDTTRIEPEKRLKSEQLDDDALALAELQSLVDGDTPFRTVESEEFYSGAAPGVSGELLIRLGEGTFAFRKHIDLHGFIREDAKDALVSFIAEARREGERCVLVITGRGRSSPGGISVIREALPRWLSRFPLRSHVLAYCTAKSVDGGPGAFYVLLRR
ncbi:MAG: Smr/MutS family protein [Clostridia bacterium]|nr:Smr/MutS family protein [Deltaproteobacteria bacterium]